MKKASVFLLFLLVAISPQNLRAENFAQDAIGLRQEVNASLQDSFDRIAQQNKKQNERIAELEKRIEGLENERDNRTTKV